VGRFAAEKQPHLALAAALHLQKPIVVAARLDAFGMPYYQTACEPLMSHPLVTYKGEVTDTGKIGIFQQAAVNLHPVPMEEPFGLTVVEAGLCGTPTIAFDKGSMRELIKEGIAGFVVNNLTELLNVYPRALSLDRKQVRAHFEQFNHLQMAKEYEQAYERLLRRSKGGNEQQEGGW
jgi:glycosyltransferase involved in cell wall biosynthesis